MPAGPESCVAHRPAGRGTAGRRLKQGRKGSRSRRWLARAGLRTGQHPAAGIEQHQVVEKTEPLASLVEEGGRVGPSGECRERRWRLDRIGRQRLDDAAVQRVDGPEAAVHMVCHHQRQPLQVLCLTVDAAMLLHERQPTRHAGDGDAQRQTRRDQAVIESPGRRSAA